MSISTATCCSPTTRGPASRSRTACRSLRTDLDSALRPRRLVILAEGKSEDTHYGKTGRGVMRYRPEDVVAVLDSQSRATEHEGFPLVRSVPEARELGATAALVGV